jgi:putative ABC transport system substrate-binding protein
MILRRDFITLLGGAAATWPVAARAQRPGKLPLVGVLGSASPSVQDRLVGGFRQRLRDLGWTEGRTVAIEVRWAEGRADRADEIAAEFARLKVDVIVTSSAVNILAAKRAAPNTPIVFAVATDPVGTGLVASLARPGGTITGSSSQGADYSGKQIELLREMIPALRRIGVIGNAGTPGAVEEMRAFESEVRMHGYEPATFEIRSAEDIGPAFDALKGKVDALDVVSDGLILASRIRIITLALAARVPAIYGNREFPEVGGLMSFGPSLPDLYRRAADFVDKILHGTKPADIPVEQPTKFDIVINLTTAKALGLTVPSTLLAIANEVIE